MAWPGRMLADGCQSSWSAAYSLDFRTFVLADGPDGRFLVAPAPEAGARVIRSPAVAFLRGCLPGFVYEALHHSGITQDIELRVGCFGVDCPHDIREAATPVCPYPAPVFRLLTASAQRPPGASQEGEVQTALSCQWRLP